MAHWKEKMTLGDLHDKVEGGVMTVTACAQEVGARLKALTYYTSNDEFRELVDEMIALGQDADTDEDDYDDVLAYIYDWCDIDYRLWITA